MTLETMLALGALLSGICTMLCALMTAIRSRELSRLRQHGLCEEDGEGLSGLMDALTPEDKAWLRSHGWNGILRATRRQP